MIHGAATLDGSLDMVLLDEYVPEPSGLAMLAVAIGGMLARRRRRG